jgi:transposase
MYWLAALGGSPMPAKRYLVELTPEERQDLTKLVSAGKGSARTLTRARILLKADQAAGGPGWDDGRIADALGCGRRTVERVRRRLVEEGLDAALTHKPQARPSVAPKLDGRAEAKLIALACSDPPDGRAGWTLRLLADRLVGLEVVDSVSYETVRRTLKKTR